MKRRSAVLPSACCLAGSVNSVIVLPFVRVTVSCPESSFASLPLLISGPFVSRRIAREFWSSFAPAGWRSFYLVAYVSSEREKHRIIQTNVHSSLTCAKAKFSVRSSTSSVVACEKFKRIIFIPASVTFSRGSRCSLVGPIVATILDSCRPLSLEGSGSKNEVFVKVRRVWTKEAERVVCTNEDTAARNIVVG